MGEPANVNEEYPTIYEEYCSATEKCIATSQRFAEIPSPTSAHYYASALFTKLCTSSISIRMLSPEPDQIGFDAHWDFASVCALTRSLVECYLVFYYLCRACSESITH